MPRDGEPEDDDRPIRRRPRDENDDTDRPVRSRRRMDDAEAPPRSKKKGKLGLVLIIIGGVFVVCCGGLSVAGYFLWNKVSGPVREQVATADNLKEIGMAMHNHEARNGALPNNSYDRQGRPLLSWRVHLLPSLGEDALYKQFKLDEPWDSPNNKPLIAKMPRVYGSSAANARAGEGNTYYRGFSHQGAIFEQPRAPGVVGKISIVQIPDGLANTIFVIEAGGAVEWTRPLDIDWPPAQSRPPLGIPELDYCMVLMCDGSVRRLRKDVADQTLRNLISRNDGMVIPPGWEK